VDIEAAWSVKIVVMMEFISSEDLIILIDISSPLPYGIQNGIVKALY
jgi:hypothetical protein